jgi:hypothetical protein
VRPENRGKSIVQAGSSGRQLAGRHLSYRVILRSHDPVDEGYGVFSLIK